MAQIHVFVPRVIKTTDEIEHMEDRLDIMMDEYAQCESNGIITGQLDLAHKCNKLQYTIRIERKELQAKNDRALIDRKIRFVVLDREERVVTYQGTLRAAYRVAPKKLFYTIHMETADGVRECVMRCTDRSETGFKFKQLDWVFSSKRFWDQYSGMIYEFI